MSNRARSISSTTSSITDDFSSSHHEEDRSNSFDYQIIQSNGQRIYCPAAGTATPIPPKGCEIFVGNLPRNLFEEELLGLFLEIGPIYKLRLMMDFSGATRGFAFITYFTRSDTNRAVKLLNNFPIRAEAVITVHLSLDNCRLFFGNIPRNKSRKEINEHLVRFMDGIVDVILYQEPAAPALNRGFVFVEFDSHAAAAIARRQMLAGTIRLWESQRTVFVDWAEPEPYVSADILNQVTILYVKNIPVECTGQKLKNAIVSKIFDIPIMRLYKKNNYAFVHFYSRAMAERALTFLQNTPMVINGRNVDVEWARPKKFSKKNRAETRVVNHLCLSVPPKLRRIVEKSKRHNCIKKESVSSSAASSDGTQSSTNIDEIFVKQFMNLHF